MLGKLLIYGSVIIAALATVAPDLGVPYALVLVALGLVSGFVAPITDVTTRIAYYVLAVALPGIADQADAIPVVGMYVNGFLDQMAVVIAGVAIASVLLALMGQLRDA